MTKFTFGVDGVALTVYELGVKIQIVVNLDMVSINRDLYRQYSNGCLCEPSRSLTTGRKQLILELSQKEVREHIYEARFVLFA